MSLALAGLSLAACQPSVSVGVCDGQELASRTVVYRVSDGEPAYAGQAYILGTCARCHAAEGAERMGAPAIADYDLRLVQGLDADGSSATRLRGAQGNVFLERAHVYGAIVTEWMPPGGTLTPDYVSYADDAPETPGVPLPGLDTPAGREIVRVWLACGSPIVEGMTAAEPVPCTTDADCSVTHQCYDRECLGVGDTVSRRPVCGGTPLPELGWLAACVEAPRCQSASCHGGSAMTGFTRPLTSAVRALASAACGGERLIVPGDVESSALLSVLERRCGAHVEIDPNIDAATLQVVRDWIAAGAR